MMEFIVKPECIKKMKKFMKLLKQKGINCKSKVGEKFVLIVDEDNASEVDRLAKEHEIYFE